MAPLALPPLRERPGDILPLTEYFIEFYRQRLGLTQVALGAEAARRLLQHGWPGNIRELENAVHHALLVCREGTISPSDFRLTSLPARPRPVEPSSVPRVDPLSALTGVLGELFEAGLPDLWDRIERAVMSSAYDYCERNQVQTARLLGGGLAFWAFRSCEQRQSLLHALDPGIPSEGLRPIQRAMATLLLLNRAT